jgi:hypothetical protein
MFPPLPIIGIEAYNSFWGIVGLAEDLLPAGNLLLTGLLFVALIVARFPQGD